MPSVGSRFPPWTLTVPPNFIKPYLENLFFLDMPNIQKRMFPVYDMENSVGGALVYSGSFHVPSETHGMLIYLNADPNLQLVLYRVEAGGGKIMVRKTEISAEYGFKAVFIETEGNRIALHSSPVA
jgi:predicted enzyme related to lactoylglutathione lyase